MSATQYLHEKNIAHTNINEHTILLRGETTVKLSNLSHGILANPLMWRWDSVQRDAPVYPSPEMRRMQTLTSAVDLFAVGCVVYNLLTGAKHEVFHSSYDFYGSYRVDDLSSSRPMRDAVRSLLNHDPSLRRVARSMWDMTPADAEHLQAAVRLIDDPHSFLDDYVAMKKELERLRTMTA